MAITASGIYFLTMEKSLITTGPNWEAETNKIMLDSDTDTPAFDTHDFRNDVATEVTGTNWASGGVALTTTEITVTSGTLIYSAANVSVATTTIANAMASILTAGNATASADTLLMLHDFVTAVSTTAGTFGINWSSGQLVTADLTP